MRFLLETFGYDEVQALPGNGDYDLDTVTAMLEEGAKVLVNEFLPLNALGDRAGLVFDPDTGDVTMPSGFKKAWKTFCANGLMGLHHSPEYGGSGMPYMPAVLLGEVTSATNKSFSMCPGLSAGLYEAISHHGTEHQKATFLPKLVSGEWSGTMCLTEPQCGTDLGLVSSKATEYEDHYKITGTKIWITFGEHDLCDNIIHLVLARLPGAPEGIKGISCFIVPKVLDDGTRNGIKCTGLEHKMGIKASPTCVMSMEEAEGWLIGEPHRGMRTMFVMMNSARLEVGLEGMALSEAAYQAAVAYARDRRQSRSLDKSKRDLNAKADCILVHPDVRRMLANIKATNEGMRALIAWTAKQSDIAHGHPDEARRNGASDLLELLTPILKSYCTERGFLNISEAMQVCGGAGYTQDWPVEQLMRDERIAMIYEGTNHIQALDLVGRKLPQGGGRLVRAFAGEVTKTIKAHKADERMEPFLGPLKDASKALTAVTMELGAKGMKDPEEVAAVASNYLNIFALTALALVWARMAAKTIDERSPFEVTKLKTARYFMSNVLPEIHSLVSLVKAGKAQMMAFEDEEF